MQSLSVRLGGHKVKSQQKKNKALIYVTINADEFGWGNWFIELYVEFPCDNREQLLKKEGEVILWVEQEKNGKPKIIEKNGEINRHINHHINHPEINRHINHPEINQYCCINNKDRHMNHQENNQNYYINNKEHISKIDKNYINNYFNNKTSILITKHLFERVNVYRKKI